MERLYKMSMEETKKYQKYKCKDLKKAFIISLLMLPVFLSCMVISLPQVVEAYRIIYVIMVVVAIFGTVFMNFYYWKRMKEMTMDDGNPYEYAVVTAECKKNIQLDREDGEEHIYSFDSKDSDTKKNNRVMLVYIPHSSRIFKENLTVLEKIRS